jgi:hypothetical protein
MGLRLPFAEEMAWRPEHTAATDPSDLFRAALNRIYLSMGREQRRAAVHRLHLESDDVAAVSHYVRQN